MTYIKENRIVLALCNPILDIIIPSSDSVIQELGLEKGTSYVGDDDSTFELIDDIMRNGKKIQFVAGGSLLNSLRVLHELLKGEDKEHVKLYFTGAIGDDSSGILLQELVVQAGIHSYFHIKNDINAKTAACAAFISNKERTLLAALGAAKDYSLDTFKSEDIQNVLKNAFIVAASGYFIQICFDAVFESAVMCKKKPNTIFILNISSTTFAEKYVEEFLKLLPYVDYLIGNTREFLSFCNAIEKRIFINDIDLKNKGIEVVSTKGSLLSEEDYKKDHSYEYNKTPSEPFEKKMVELYRYLSSSARVICTRSEYPTVLIQRNMDNISNIDISYFNVFNVLEERQVDLNGCGDAFQGGLFYGLVKNYDIDTCISLGNYAASVVLQNVGCSFDFSTKPSMDELIEFLTCSKLKIRTRKVDF